MRVLILGAAGRAGRAVLSHLCLSEGVEEIILADRDAEDLVKLAGFPSPVPVRLRYLEADSDESLRRRVHEADLVVGCLGPFHIYEERVLDAVLEEGKDYLSLCDDSTVTRKALARGDEAGRRGLRVILGCGMTPGISNLLACRAAHRLGEARYLHFAWWLGGGLKAGAATLGHLLHALSGKVELLREGRVTRVRCGSWGELVELPLPAGRQYMYHLDHPEVFTVTRVLTGVRETWFKASCGGMGEDLALQTMAWLGAERYADLLAHTLDLALTGRAGAVRPHCPSVIRVTAGCSRDGPHRRVHVAVAGDYYRLSGAFVAACLEWMRWVRPKAGIYTPEEFLDHPSFYRLLHRFGVRFLRGEEGRSPEREMPAA